jgi:hypothetical protein
MFNYKPFIYEEEQDAFLIDASFSLNVKKFIIKWKELEKYLNKLVDLDYVKTITFKDRKVYTLTLEGNKLGLEFTKFKDDKNYQIIQNKLYFALVFLSFITLLVSTIYNYFVLNASFKFLYIITFFFYFFFSCCF